MYNNIGILRGSLKDYTGAIRAFKRAKRRNPEDPRFDRNMGITYTYMKKYGSAEKAFKDAITLAPKQSEYWLELGELYSFYLKDYGAAKRFYLDMMAKNSGDMDILKAYANFSENINHDYREALIYWQILQDNDRDHAGDYEKKIGALKKKLQ
jgi:tetratricopeptide (TPR) repeat protein